MRRTACLLALLAAPVPSPAQLSATAPAAQVASTPAKEILAVRSAIDASPLDCGAVERAFSVLSHSGRQPGDVEAIVLARRTNQPCATRAADATAKALAIPNAEVVAWVLSHPESMPVVDAAGVTPDGELGVPLSCGLLLVDRHLDYEPTGSRVVLTFRNKTDANVAGHDIVVRVNGQPWRSLVLPKGEVPPEPPLGAAEKLAWDTSSGSWQDQRQIETRPLKTWPPRKEARLLEGPVPPGGTFDVIARVEGLTAETKASDLEIAFDSCVLR